MSKIVIKYFCFYLLTCLVFNSCVSSKKNYSYSVVSYAIDSTKHLLSSSNLISYGDYVFEFKMTRRTLTEIHAESGTFNQSLTYDTTGVYLLSKNNKLYYQFDTFSLKTNIVQAGKNIDKAFGVNLVPPVKDNSKSSLDSFLFEKPKRIMINNIECFYINIIAKYKTSNEFEQRLISIKDKNLNSLHKIYGLKYTDPQYCIIGYSAFNLKAKDGYSDEIESFRQLTDSEKNICEEMIMKSKACVTDTIKGITNLDRVGY